MELIHNNPYRVAGVLANANAKELSKQKIKISAYTKVGKEIKSDYDFQILQNITRTEDTINKAFSNIEQNQDKVNFALFWFIEDLGVKHLIAGNEEKAIDIWEKLTQNKEVSAKNYSSFNNLGTYKLLRQNQDDIKTGIEAKIKLIESDYFENFVHAVADETYSIDSKKQSEKLIDDLLKQLEIQYSSTEVLEFFSNCNLAIQKHIAKRLIEKPIHKIESQIESCKKKRKVDKGNAYQFGLKLYTNTKDDLSLVKLLLSTNDLKYKAVADILASEIMQCGIDYYIECKKNDSTQDYLKQAQEFNSLALFIAEEGLVKERARDHFAILNNFRIENSLKLVLDKININKTNKSIYFNLIEKLFVEGYLSLLKLSKDVNLIESDLKPIYHFKVGIEQLIIVLINNSISKPSQLFTMLESGLELLDFIIIKIPYSQKANQKLEATINEMNKMIDNISYEPGNFFLQQRIIMRKVEQSSKYNDGRYNLNEVDNRIKEECEKLNDLQSISITKTELIANNKHNNDKYYLWKSTRIKGKYKSFVQELDKLKEWQLFRSKSVKINQLLEKTKELEKLLLDLNKEKLEGIFELETNINDLENLKKVLQYDI